MFKWKKQALQKVRFYKVVTPFCLVKVVFASAMSTNVMKISLKTVVFKWLESAVKSLMIIY